VRRNATGQYRHECGVGLHYIGILLERSEKACSSVEGDPIANAPYLICYLTPPSEKPLLLHSIGGKKKYLATKAFGVDRIVDNDVVNSFRDAGMRPVAIHCDLSFFGVEAPLNSRLIWISLRASIFHPHGFDQSIS
jgi:hypothetical protein